MLPRHFNNEVIINCSAFVLSRSDRRDESNDCSAQAAIIVDPFQQLAL